ncbi:MAG: hypothetical protein WCY06_07305 [Flavobacteriaceae bacterium]
MYSTDFLVGKMPVNLEKVNEYGLAVAIENDFAIIFLDQTHLFHSSIKFNHLKYHSDNDKMEFGGDLVHFFAKEIGLKDYVIMHFSYNNTDGFYGEFYKDAQKEDEGENINDLLKKLGVVVSDKEDEFHQLNFREYSSGSYFYLVGDANRANRYNNVIAGRIDRQKVKLEYYNFTNEYDEWCITEYLSSIAEFKYKGYNAEGYIEFYIEQRGNDEKPQKFQENTFDYFIENHEKVLNALCNGVIEHYPKMMKMYKVEEFNTEFGFPELKSIDDVKNIISIGAINVLEEEKDNFSYLGFSCKCSWDEEHGLRITMHKDRVINVDNDSSYYAYKEILKDKMTEEEWKAYTDNFERIKEENLAKYYKEQEEVLQKEIEENNVQKESSFEENIKTTNTKEIKTSKKWWQFWK